MVRGRGNSSTIPKNDPTFFKQLSQKASQSPGGGPGCTWPMPHPLPPQAALSGWQTDLSRGELVIGVPPETASCLYSGGAGMDVISTLLKPMPSKSCSKDSKHKGATLRGQVLQCRIDDNNISPLLTRKYVYRRHSRCLSPVTYHKKYAGIQHESWWCNAFTKSETNILVNNHLILFIYNTLSHTYTYTGAQTHVEEQQVLGTYSSKTGLSFNQQCPCGPNSFNRMVIKLMFHYMQI